MSWSLLWNLLPILQWLIKALCSILIQLHNRRLHYNIEIRISLINGWQKIRARVHQSIYDVNTLGLFQMKEGSRKIQEYLYIEKIVAVFHSTQLLYDLSNFCINSLNIINIYNVVQDDGMSYWQKNNFFEFIWKR